MSRIKEITEDLGKRVDVTHQARKVCETISKELDSTNPQSGILYLSKKWSTNKNLSKQNV